MNSIFNNESRKKNVAKSSVFSAVTNVFNMVIKFVYRALFVQILATEYLGINGLFTNILTLLSLSELGITGAITYRFYKPISEGDVKKVGELMGFIKTVYRIIAVIIFSLGISVIPWLNFFIKDTSQIPQDVNIVFVYILFVVKTVSSYTYAYKQVILTADQKQYMVSIIQCFVNLSSYSLQIIILVISHNYVGSIIIDILTTVGLNYFIGLFIEKKYQDVFKIKERLSKEEKKNIFHDTQANMLHKIGYVVLNGTDSIVVSKFVGLVETGIYSNYSLVLGGLNSIIGQVLGSFTATLGNANVELSKEDNYKIFKKMIFVNFFIASVTTICLYTLLDNFIMIWLNKGLLLDKLTVVCICVQYYFEISRKICTSYTNSSGQFVRDRIRPIIEAILNIVISVILVKIIGIAGVFLGTIISHVLTVFWREPHILYKYVFERSSRWYWIRFFQFSIITIIFCIIFSSVYNESDNWLMWLLNAIIVFVCSSVGIIVLFLKTEEEKYFIDFIKKVMSKMKINR